MSALSFKKNSNYRSFQNVNEATNISIGQFMWYKNTLPPFIIDATDVTDVDIRQITVKSGTVTVISTTSLTVTDYIIEGSDNIISFGDILLDEFLTPECYYDIKITTSGDVYYSEAMLIIDEEKAGASSPVERASIISSFDDKGKIIDMKEWNGDLYILSTSGLYSYDGTSITDIDTWLELYGLPYLSGDAFLYEFDSSIIYSKRSSAPSIFTIKKYNGTATSDLATFNSVTSRYVTLSSSLYRVPYQLNGAGLALQQIDELGNITDRGNASTYLANIYENEETLYGNVHSLFEEGGVLFALCRLGEGEYTEKTTYLLKWNETTDEWDGVHNFGRDIIVEYKTCHDSSNVYFIDWYTDKAISCALDGSGESIEYDESSGLTSIDIASSSLWIGSTDKLYKKVLGNYNEYPTPTTGDVTVFSQFESAIYFGTMSGKLYKFE